jgi:hypothetical protein
MGAVHRSTSTRALPGVALEPAGDSKTTGSCASTPGWDNGDSETPAERATGTTEPRSGLVPILDTSS